MARHQSNKAIIIFEGVLEINRWYLVAICLRNLPSKWEYRHWPPTHLEVYVSNPLHYSVTCPNNGVPILVLTFCPTCLQGLWKHNTQITAQALNVHENTERGQGRMRACWDNAAPKGFCVPEAVGDNNGEQSGKTLCSDWGKAAEKTSLTINTFLLPSHVIFDL